MLKLFCRTLGEMKLSNFFVKGEKKSGYLHFISANMIGLTICKYELLKSFKLLQTWFDWLFVNMDCSSRFSYPVSLFYILKKLFFFYLNIAILWPHSLLSIYYSFEVSFWDFMGICEELCDKIGIKSVSSENMQILSCDSWWFEVINVSIETLFILLCYSLLDNEL